MKSEKSIVITWTSIVQLFTCMVSAQTNQMMMNEPLKRSKLGIASLVIAIGTFVIASASVVIAIMLADKKSHGVGARISDGLFYAFLIGAPAAHLVGLILGIAALFQKRKGKLFAVFGIILNILFPAGAILILFALLSAASGFR